MQRARGVRLVRPLRRQRLIRPPLWLGPHAEPTPPEMTSFKPMSLPFGICHRAVLDLGTNHRAVHNGGSEPCQVSSSALSSQLLLPVVSAALSRDDPCRGFRNHVLRLSAHGAAINCHQACAQPAAAARPTVWSGWPSLVPGGSFGGPSPSVRQKVKGSQAITAAHPAVLRVAPWCPCWSWRSAADRQSLRADLRTHQIESAVAILTARRSPRIFRRLNSDIFRRSHVLRHGLPGPAPVGFAASGLR